MAQSKQKICRLCLNVEDNNYTGLDASAIGKVKAIIPELILKFPNDTFICSKCREVLEKSFELKRTFSKNNELIQNEKLNSKCEQVDLNTVIKDGKPNSSENICRVCLKRIGGNYIHINNDNDDEFRNVLKYCVPELDVNLTLKPAICLECYDLLYEMYSFKKECLSVEEKVQSYYGSSSPKEIDLKRVLQLSRSEEENDFLSGFEVQDEEGTDIFDNIPEEDSRKRPAPTVHVEPPQEIKKPRLTGEITDEELPPFVFDTGLLLTPVRAEVSVEDWLARVEEYKRKFSWSDYTTIHKVLVKLKPIRQLYIWFSNIADIMDWEQWRKKLARAFPPRTDYHGSVRRMMTRRKKASETYVSYYTDKMELMEPLKLTPEQKVSCIFGGIADVLICCVGRVGDYKTPEELLDYFKSCDDRQSVEEEAALVDSTSPAGNKAKPVPGKPTTAAQNAKKKLRCFICRSMGHAAAECWSSKKMAEGKPPKPTSQKEAELQDIQCYLCGVMGHRSYKCPDKVAGTIPNTVAPKQKAEKRKEPGPAQQHKQKCTNCGGFGTRKKPCCPAKRYQHSSPADAVPAPTPSGGSYIGSYNAAAIAYNGNICLRCYKSGHLTKDCQNFSRNPFRN